MIGPSESRSASTRLETALFFLGSIQYVPNAHTVQGRVHYARMRTLKILRESEEKSQSALLFLGDSRIIPCVCHRRRHRRRGGSRTKHPLGRTLFRGLVPVLDLQHVKLDAVSETIGVALGVLEEGSENENGCQDPDKVVGSRTKMWAAIMMRSSYAHLARPPARGWT